MISDSISRGYLIVFRTPDGRFLSGRVEDVTVLPIQKMSHMTIHLFGSRETFVIFGSMLERDPEMILECYDPEASVLSKELPWIVGDT